MHRLSTNSASIIHHLVIIVVVCCKTVHAGVHEQLFPRLGAVALFPAHNVAALPWYAHRLILIHLLGAPDLHPLSLQSQICCTDRCPGPACSVYALTMKRFVPCCLYQHIRHLNALQTVLTDHFSKVACSWLACLDRCEGFDDVKVCWRGVGSSPPPSPSHIGPSG